MGKTAARRTATGSRPAPTAKGATGRVRQKKGEAVTVKGSDVFYAPDYSLTDDSNVLDVIEQIRKGIPSRSVWPIINNTPFTLGEFATYIGLSSRSLQRYRTTNKPFEPIQSEKIMELVLLYNYGVDVFGDKNNFDTWLLSKSIPLGGKTPKELLDTHFGISMVKDELGRIEHGVLA